MSELGTSRGEKQRWLSWAILLLLLGLALILRWRYIQEISLFVDEFVTAWAARNVLLHGLPIFPSGNFYPHGLTFTYLEVPFVLGAFDETLARIPALLISLAGLPLAYWVGRKLFSEQVGLIAAAVMAVDPDCIVWGSRARMYGLLQLLALLVVYIYYRGLADDRPRDRYLAMGLLVVAIFTHLEAAFLLPALGLATLLVLPWRRLFRWSVILPFVLGAAGALVFFLISNYGQPGHLESLDREGRSYLDLSASILRGPQAFAPVLIDLHRLPFTLLALAGFYFLFRPHFDRKSPLAYLYLLFSSFVLLVVLLAGPTWQRERYLFLALPLLFLIGGEVLTRLLRLLPPLHLLRSLRQRGAGTSVLLVFLVVLYVGLTGAPSAYVQEWGYDRAFRYLRDEQDLTAQDRIVTSMSTASNLYLGRDDAFAIQQGYEEYVVTPPGYDVPVDLWTATPVLTTTAGLADLLATAPRVWFVTDGWRFQTRYQPDFILTVLDQMDLVYDERGVMVFRSEGFSPRPEPAFQRERQADFDEELRLLGFGLSPAQVDPGTELEVTLSWQALAQAGPDYTVFLHLIAPDGSGLAGTDERLLGGLYQPSLWPSGQAVSDRHRLALPPDLPPGRYRLDLGLYRSGQPEVLLSVAGDSRLPLAMLTVGQEAAPLPPMTPAYLDFGHQIRLLGYDVQRGADRELRITLYWQSLQPAERDYTVFAQLLDPGLPAAAGIVDQDDGPPGDPFFPTITWLPGAEIVDLRTLALPGDAPAGDYVVFIGLYHQPSGERLNVTDAHGEPLGDAFRLGPISFGQELP